MKLDKKHRKIFYVPGMISLVLLPLLMLYFFSSNKSFVKETAMVLGLPNKEEIPQMLQNVPCITQRNFKEFKLNGTLETEKDNLQKFQSDLKKLNKIHDTVNGIKLHFGKQMKYEVFIRVLDILTIENTPTYIPIKNDLLIVNGAPSDIKKANEIWEKEHGKHTKLFCGTQDAMNRQKEFDELNQKLIANEEFQKSFFNNHWYLFLAYFGIVLLNLFVLIKFNRNRIYNQKSYI